MKKSSEPIVVAGRRYENPRSIPKRWIESYLARDREQLALDVMRAFDENWKLKSRLEREKLMRWLTTAALVALWEIFKAIVFHN